MTYVLCVCVKHEIYMYIHAYMYTHYTTHRPATSCTRFVQRARIADALTTINRGHLSAHPLISLQIKRSFTRFNEAGWLVGECLPYILSNNDDNDDDEDNDGMCERDLCIPSRRKEFQFPAEMFAATVCFILSEVCSLGAYPDCAIRYVPQA